MPKTILNPVETQECCAAMAGLSGARASAEAKRLADYFGCHVSRIYEATKHLRPKRKARTDKGNRRADLKNHPGIAFATSLVVAKNLDPKIALETTRANYAELGFATPEEATPITLGTFRRMLREAGVNRAQRRSKVVVHRRFEAKLPGQIFQFDISGVKQRMVDVRNKRILQVHAGDVNSNHPNTKSTRVKLWKFTMVDDCARKKFTRFVATDKPNSCDVIDFELEAFREMGVPLALYTDNDAVIVSRLNRRAAAILDRAFADSGGFKLEQHMPYNSNATGKVENSHQWVEEMEKLIGIGELPTMDQLNDFAVNFCDLYNWTENRTTRQKPEIHFRAGHGVMRMPPAELLNDAFKAREFEVKVNSDVTISVDTVRWQLPRREMIASSLTGAKEISNPFIDLAQLGKTVQVVWPIEAKWFLAIAGGNEFEIAKVEAVADAAYEHKAVVASTSERNMQHFKGVAADRTKAIKEGKEAPIVRPGIDVPFEIAAEARPAMMPRKKVEASLEEWMNAAPGAVPASATEVRMLNYFAAVELLQGEELMSVPPSAADQSWLKAVLAGRVEMPEPELRERAARREASPIVEVRYA